MTNALATIQPMTPQEYDADVSAAHLKARTLMAVAEAQKLYVQIGQGKHLRVEGWLTIGRAYGYTTGTGETEILWAPDGTVYGVKATAYVYDGNGIRVGQAENYCTRDEENWGDKPVAQMAGMAQTRAVSRALRQLLAWVVVLAGYSATPAEEMIASKSKRGTERPTPVGVSTGAAQVDYNLCPIHKVEWFKRGQMRDFAHPIEGQKGKWCNQADVEKEIDRVAALVPTEEDLGFGQGSRLIDPETLPWDASQGHQEPPDTLFPSEEAPVPVLSGGGGSGGLGDKRLPPFPLRGEKEAAVNYYLKAAKERYGLSQKEALAAIGGTWSGWADQHGGEGEVALQAAWEKMGKGA